MHPVMTSASKLNGILFAVLLGAMLVYSLPAAWRFAADQSGHLALFVDGKLLRNLETRYDRELFLRDPAIRLWANAQYLLFGEGLQGVVLGHDGWLFTNQEYLVPNDLEQSLQAQLARIERVREALAAHHKQLILLPVPMKLDIYAEQARHRPNPHAVGLYERFTRELAAREVAVVPVRQAFLDQRHGESLFLRRDTHWTPAGARLAARELARQQPALVGVAPYRSEAVGQKLIPGDLMNYIRFDEHFAPAIFAPEHIALFETLNPAQQLSADALFGDSSPPIALVGSSYTKIEDWNFSGFLKEALQSDVVSVAVEAHGPFQAMQDFTDSGLLNNDEIHTVVWEFPVRTLLAEAALGRRWQAMQQQSF